jgi:hypothetical protein
MRNLTAAGVLFVVAAAGAARTQQAQAPGEPTLDFTMNYINSSIDGSIQVKGTTLMFIQGKRPYPFETGSFDIAKDPVSASGGAEEGDAVCIVCPNNGYLCIAHFQQYNKKDTDYSRRQNVCLGVKGNQFKAQDVANAFNRLFALMKAQHKEQLQQEQQQNQSDPFANPQ